MSENLLLAPYTKKLSGRLYSFLNFSHLLTPNQKTETGTTTNSTVPPQVNKLLLKQLAEQETPKPESDKDFEAKRRLFLEYKNTVYQNYNESLEKLESSSGRKLNNTEKYGLFINKFFEDVEGLSALLPNRYNTERETSRMFLNHFIKTFSKNENQILNGTS